MHKPSRLCKTIARKTIAAMHCDNDESNDIDRRDVDFEHGITDDEFEADYLEDSTQVSVACTHSLNAYSNMFTTKSKYECLY